MHEPIAGMRQNWQAWHPTAAMFFVNGALIGMWATQIPSLKERLGLAPFVLSLILLMLGGGTVVAMAFSAWLIQRIGVGRSIRVSAVVYCSLAGLIPLAPSVVALGVIVLLFGASGGTMNVAMNAHASDVEKRYGRPYMSSFHGMWSLGGLSAASAGALLMRAFGPAVEALVITVAIFVMFVWAQRGLLADRQADSSEQASGKTRLSLFGPALLLGVVATFAFACEGVVLDWAAVYMRHTLGAGNEIALMGYAVFAGFMALMRFAGDIIRRKFSSRALVCAGGLIAATGLLAGPVSQDPFVMIVGCAIAGAGLANVVPVLFSMAGALPRPAVQIATVSAMGFAGLLAAPPLLGLLGQHYGLGAIFYTGAAAATAIGILTLAGIHSSAATLTNTDASVRSHE
ncbi:MFS transporter [Burkholderia seminalis]|uniref:MFS transporter n=1 Tax=Burkholderia sp. Ed8 TaxID=3112957 RepID=UPI00158E8259|nr:MFS transporter [Burkholderia seminalis]